MVGFIGAGNMASAIIGGIVKTGAVKPSDVIVSNPHTEKLTLLSEKYGVKTTTDNKEAAKADIVFLCVKPIKLFDVALDISDSISSTTMLVSIAAGKTVSSIEEAFAKKIKLVRVMPNTPAMVGEGISAVCANSAAAEDTAKYDEVKKIMASVGEVVEVEERLVDVAGQVAGASPAWLFMVIEALADGAVLEGMPREAAYKFAAAGVAGAGKLALSEGGNPGRLKDMVTSPGGTTIEGVKVLEDNAVRGAFIDAVVASCEKAKKL